MSSCRECGVEVRFVRVEGQSYSVPIDPAPDEDGVVIARREPLLGMWSARFLSVDRDVPAGWLRYTHHSKQTCSVVINERAERAIRAREHARLNPQLPGLDEAPTDTEVAGPRATEGTTA